MSRIVNRPITMLRVSPDGAPFEYIGQEIIRMVSSVIDRWSEAGAWWVGEPDRTMYLVETMDFGVYELELSATGEWKVHKTYD